jgi:hypothetical protein
MNEQPDPDIAVAAKHKATRSTCPDLRGLAIMSASNAIMMP